jgi:tryptophan synthase alpha chain
MPYYTLGYPDRQTSLDVITAIARDSDLLELGVPFSDPLADGPTIQHSTQQALAAGTTSAACLEMVAELRQRGVTTPALLHGLLQSHPGLRRSRLRARRRRAGADGFIVPDLPPEEAEPLDELARAAGLVLIPFLAPTSDPARVRRIATRARGFIYMVSLTGVTGTSAPGQKRRCRASCGR